MLVDEACRVQVGAQHNQAPYRQVLGRAFARSVMKDACKSFGGGTLKRTRDGRGRETFDPAVGGVGRPAPNGDAALSTNRS
jgi:hypothetical protein